ncbi:MAG TPA: hypothetical protein VLI92_02630 [Candidatus Saccharimonadales bacterium]|nr:hypothetical protein [Candidatus Saccharimonadales bacterium]
MFLSFLKSKFGFLIVLILIFVGVYYVLFSKIQESSNVLGISSETCANKLDLNCDSDVNSKDLATVTEYIKSIKPTPTPIPSPTTKASPTPTPTPGTTSTPTPTPTPSSTPSGNDPYPGAPLCPDSGAAHDNTKFHTLWDPVRRCHYDHEHGVNPFNAQVASTFPGFDLKNLIGNVEIGHTNLSSPMENTLKHGGFKWQTTLATPENCNGFESATNGVNAAVMEYHGFGNYAIELEARVHTALGLLRMCNSSNPTDYGYLYTTQFEDYGQKVVPYQGTNFAYPNSPDPTYNSASGPYLSVDCIGNVIQCRASRDLVVSRHLRAFSNWTAKPTGRSGTVGSTLYQIFFRVRDTYQLYDWNDQIYPFTFIYLCSSDGGVTYNPRGCNYNNTTTQVNEIAGKIPAEWDNMPGFDTDSRVGRITAQGYTTRFGTLNKDCTAVGPDCHPIKMVNAFVGTYSALLFYTDGKGTNLTPFLPERDIYFCNGHVCNETDAGATPSGWVGDSN